MNDWAAYLAETSAGHSTKRVLQRRISAGNRRTRMRACEAINAGALQGRLRLATQRDDHPTFDLMPGHRLDRMLHQCDRHPLPPVFPRQEMTRLCNVDVPTREPDRLQDPVKSAVESDVWQVPPSSQGLHDADWRILHPTNASPRVLARSCCSIFSEWAIPNRHRTQHRPMSPMLLELIRNLKLAATCDDALSRHARSRNDRCHVDDGRPAAWLRHRLAVSLCAERHGAGWNLTPVGAASPARRRESRVSVRASHRRSAMSGVPPGWQARRVVPPVSRDRRARRPPERRR